MPPRIDWESQLGRRIRLRDLHVFATTVRLGSMAKAAKELGVSQPAVSEVISALEHVLGVPLLDRIPRGVEPTIYGSALLRRSIGAFDELRQGIKEIEFLSDPTAGELRIGCPESIAAGYLQPIVARFAKTYPRVVLDIDTVNTQTFSPKLRERQLDLMLARAGSPLDQPGLVDDFSIETLFDDKLVVVVGRNNPLARRRKLAWPDLAEHAWVLTGSDLWNHQVVAEAFSAHGMKPPRIQMKTISVHLRANMAATRNCITTLPWSVMLFNEQPQLKMLPLALPSRSWPIMAVTLKHRAPNPIVARFLESARAVARSTSGCPSP